MNDATGAEAGGAQREEGGVVEVGAGRVVGLGEIEQDQVEAFALAVEVVQAAGGVADAQRDAGVLEGAGGEGGQMRSNGGDHGGVEFGDDDACEARVPEQLAGAGAISTA